MGDQQRDPTRNWGDPFAGLESGLLIGLADGGEVKTVLPLSVLSSRFGLAVHDDSIGERTIRGEHSSGEHSSGEHSSGEHFMLPFSPLSIEYPWLHKNHEASVPQTCSELPETCSELAQTSSEAPQSDAPEIPRCSVVVSETVETNASTRRRVRSHLKLKVRKFKDLKDEDFTDANAFIQDKFDIDLAKQEHKDCIRGIMMDLYQKYRGQLHFWYKKNRDFPQGKLTPYLGVSLEDWEYQCEHVFIDEAFKMSFQRIFVATKETSRINQFKLTHYSDKKGGVLEQKKNMMRCLMQKKEVHIVVELHRVVKWMRRELLHMSSGIGRVTLKGKTLHNSVFLEDLVGFLLHSKLKLW
ncbi:hypothetical protein H6P81_013423 [Aristolochia fimbriata]|uniref:Uncharacterized protein n=1 Tax=Aristolochia fimbriata TaxID=158543 RepID=A0AAV7EGV4_ARIFI|nr:hypothetical protein H6P81_013423 [Aristolochia fimbriata]